MNRRAARGSVIWIALFAFFSAGPAFAEDVLRMAYFDAFAPYSSSENGQIRGILPDAMTEACRRLNIPLENAGYPWERAQRLVKSGQADGFITAPTAERKTYALTGRESIITMGTSFFTWTGNPNAELLHRAQSLEELRGLKILDYIGDGWGKEHLAGLDVHLAPTLDQVLAMLADKRGDVFAQVGLVVGTAISKLGLWDKLQEIPKPNIPSPPFVLCLGKSSPFAARLDEFDATFRAMKDDGAMDRIIARYN